MRRPEQPQNFDVVVVGGGGSGLAAAASAAENGARVLLLEKGTELGGTTGMAVGSFTASGTSLQRARGITDHAEHHQLDAAAFAPREIEERNNEGLRRFFLAQAAETFEWLRSMGLTFHGPNPEPPNRVPRMHNVVPGAKAYIAALQSRVLGLRGRILCNAAVVRLSVRDGCVTGVVATVEGQERTFEASKGVVLAAGDYSNASDLISSHKGERFKAIEGINPGATGDGHRLLASVGAELVNMDVTYGPELRFVAPRRRSFVERLPSGGFAARVLRVLLPLLSRFFLKAFTRRLLVTWQHPENTLFDEGAILLNAHGVRFCEERRSPDREIAIAAQPRKECYILLDERLAERYSAWPHFISTAPKIAYAYVQDYLRLRRDVAVAGSLAGVCRARGIPIETVGAEIDRFNLSAALPLRGERWVLLGPAKAYFTTSEGGAAIDRQLRVLSTTGRVIPGLFAVGQTGMGGQVLWGHGLHIAWAMTSGRLAGRIVTGAPVARAQ